jgi:hypothetical protein
MKSVAVFIKRNGVLIPCPVRPTPDGCVWRCVNCHEHVIRASFGVLSGLWRCQCGCEVELLVDGQAIDLEELNALQPQYQTEEDGGTKPVNDSDFLRELGIQPDLATTEEN